MHRSDGRGGGSYRIGIGRLCDPEIRYFDHAVIGNQDILRFDIPMDNMMIMGMGKAQRQSAGKYLRSPAVTASLSF